MPAYWSDCYQQCLQLQHRLWLCPWHSNGAFTPEQDNDKTTTRQMLNLCISIMPFTPGPACRCLVVVLLWCESTITPSLPKCVLIVSITTRDATHVWGKNRKTGNKYSCHQLPFPSYPNLFRPTSPQLSLIATNGAYIGWQDATSITR